MISAEIVSELHSSELSGASCQWIKLRMISAEIVSELHSSELSGSSCQWMKLHMISAEIVSELHSSELSGASCQWMKLRMILAEIVSELHSSELSGASCQWMKLHISAEIVSELHSSELSGAAPLREGESSVCSVVYWFVHNLLSFFLVCNVFVFFFAVMLCWLPVDESIVEWILLMSTSYAPEFWWWGLFMSTANSARDNWSMMGTKHLDAIGEYCSLSLASHSVFQWCIYCL